MKTNITLFCVWLVLGVGVAFVSGCRSLGSGAPSGVLDKAVVPAKGPRRGTVPENTRKAVAAILQKSHSDRDTASRNLYGEPMTGTGSYTVPAFSMWRSIGSLLFLFLFLVGLNLFFRRRRGLQRASGGGGERIRVVEKAIIDGIHQLVLVDVDGGRVLLTVTRDKVESIVLPVSSPGWEKE